MESFKNEAENFIESLPCHVQKPYPSPKMSFKNKKVADMLLAVYAGGGNSEMTAISQYLSHAETIEDDKISDSIFCISMVEMHHLDIIGTLIKTLGGDLKLYRQNKFYWTGGYINYGSSTCDKISLDILAEQEAIIGYDELIRSIELEKQLELQQVIDIIQRNLEDEQFHLQMFTDMFYSC